MSAPHSSSDNTSPPFSPLRTTTTPSSSFGSATSPGGYPSSPRGTLRRSGLVTTSSSFFNGPPAGTTLRELASEPDFVSLESAQRALSARRVELLKQQAQLSRDTHEALSHPHDGMLVTTLRSVHDTQRTIVDAQKRGIREHYQSPQKVAALDKSNFLGLKAAEMRSIQEEIKQGEFEEEKIVKAINNRHPGAAVGRGPRASPVTSLAAWRAEYGSPTGKLAETSNGYASTWSPTLRYYGTSLPGSGPYGHKSSKLFTGFASDGVDFRIGRDIK
jgi:hypothetical protein